MAFFASRSSEAGSKAFSVSCRSLLFILPYIQSKRPSRSVRGTKTTRRRRIVNAAPQRHPRFPRENRSPGSASSSRTSSRPAAVTCLFARPPYGCWDSPDFASAFPRSDRSDGALPHGSTRYSVILRFSVRVGIIYPDPADCQSPDGTAFRPRRRAESCSRVMAS